MHLSKTWQRPCLHAAALDAARALSEKFAKRLKPTLKVKDDFKRLLDISVCAGARRKGSIC